MLNIDSKTKVIESKYEPRRLQKWLHAKMRRFNVLNLHRRFGKTVLCINEIKDKALRNTLKNPHYAYIAPTYSSAKRVSWEYFKEYFKDVPGTEFREGDLMIKIARPEYDDTISIWLIGSDNPNSLRGVYLDGVILDEYASMPQEIWTQVLRPALSDRLGWAIFISTPMGQNSFYDIYIAAEKLMNDGKDWFAVTITAEQSGIIPESELEDAKQTMSKDDFSQEYLCDFNAALTGAYFSDIMNEKQEKGHFCDLPYDPAHAVITAWDLGISDSTAIWFVQKIPGEQYYHVIDYLEVNGKGIDYYIQELQKKNYTYSKYLFPHDAAQREFSTGKSRMDTFARKGIRNYEIIPKVGMKSDAINAVREILPLCKFDKNKCSTGIAALKNYQREYDSKNKMYKDKPVHSWSSHGSDAFQTFARGIRAEHFVFRDESFNKSLPSVAQMDYTEY